MSTRMNRRAILAGAAALPAISIPAAAAESPELLALGERIRALWPEYQETRTRRNELYEPTRELAGWNDPERQEAIQSGNLDHKLDTAHWNAASEYTGYAAACDRMNAISDPIWALAEAASELKATTMAGYGVLAVAAIIQDQFEAAPAAYDTLIGLAEAAGFRVPADDREDYDAGA